MHALKFTILGFGPGVNTKSPMHQPKSPPTRRSLSPDQPNAAEPITDSPSALMGRIGWALRTLLLSKNIQKLSRTSQF